MKWRICVYVKNKKNKNKKRRKVTGRLKCVSGRRKNTAGAAKIRRPTSDLRNALLETPQTVMD